MGESDGLGIYTETELGSARDLIRELIRVVRSFRLYEGDHPTLEEMHVRLRRSWDRATAGGPLSFTLLEQKVLLQDAEVYAAAGSNEVLPCVLHEQGVLGLVFKRGLEPNESRRLVGALACDPEAAVDYTSLLWEADLKHVQVLIDDDDELGDVPATPAEFARQLESLADDDDPAADDDHPQLRRELEESIAARVAGELPGPMRATLSDGERLFLERMLDRDVYPNTVCHALRVVHDMAGSKYGLELAGTIEKSVEMLVEALGTTGDLEGATVALREARGMLSCDSDLVQRTGEWTLDRFREPAHLWVFLRSLDRHDRLEARALGEFLVVLGSEVAGTVAQWLIETRWEQAVSQAMRVYGPDAAAVVVPLYERSTGEDRARLVPALLELGTDTALTALARGRQELDEATRLQLVQLVGRSADADLRRVVLEALEDPSDRVRRCAVGLVRKNDAPALAPIVERLLEPEGLEARGRKEVEDFFEMLSRTGDAAIAKILAAHCTPRGLRFTRRKLTGLQELCVRALRRMRLPDARRVVHELRASGPRQLRDLLNDPLGELGG